MRLENRAGPGHHLRNELGRADAVWKRPELCLDVLATNRRASVLETGLGLGCGGETLPNVINYKQTNTGKQGSRLAEQIFTQGFWKQASM